MCQTKLYPELINKWIILIFILLSFLFTSSPQTVSASGIGFSNFQGNATIHNSILSGNLNGIQATIINSAVTQNLWISSNRLFNSKHHGLKIDFADTAGSINIYNNTLDNSNVPSTGPYTRKGRFGIRIRNNYSPSLFKNTIKNFGRSAIQLQNISQVTVVNNILQSNGTQKYTVGNQYFGSGLQAANSNFSYVAGNTIRWNLFSGIAVDNTLGTIGPDNIIMYDGEKGSGSGTGNLNNCVPTIEDGGSVRGGILVQGLASEEVMTVMCSNTISSNYYKDIAKSGDGTVTSCANEINSFVLTPSHALYYYDANSGHVVHDCNNSIINAATYPFGIIIEGSGSDVTIQNCTIKNAAMEQQYTAPIGDGKLIGAGILIANEASPYISSNYIVSNGWGLLDDRIYTEAGASGIQMRCAEANSSIINNLIASNRNDGLVGKETGGLIGSINQGNTFRNNGRGGIGIYKGTTRNLEVAYNTIYNNKRGIGAIEFDGSMFTISNNIIYSNQADSTTVGGGIGFSDMGTAGNIVIIGNEIWDNSDLKSNAVGGMRFKNAQGIISLANNRVASNIGAIGGIGVTASNGNFSLVNNQIMNNIGSSDDVSSMNVGGVGFNSAGAQGQIYLGGNTLKNNRALTVGGPIRGRVGGFGISDSNATVSFVDNTIANNEAICVGGAGFDTFGGNAFVSANIIYSNTNNKSPWGAGGLAFDEASGQITISNNTVYNNTNTASGSGGVGINYLQAEASLSLNNNTIYNNISGGIGGVGVYHGSNTDLNIIQNTIYSNLLHGIGFESFAGAARITGNSIRHHNTQADLVLFSSNTMGIGIKNMAAKFVIDNNSIVSNSSGIGIDGGTGELTVTNNEIAALKSILRSGINIRKTTLANILIESNDENGGFHDLGFGYSQSDSSGPLSIVNGNLFSNIDNSSIKCEYSDLTVDIIGNQRIAAGIRFNDLDGLGGQLNIIDNPWIGYIKMTGIPRDVNISNNEIVDDKTLKPGYPTELVRADMALANSFSFYNNIVHGGRTNGVRVAGLSSDVSSVIFSNSIYDNGIASAPEGDEAQSEWNNGLLLNECDGTSVFNNLIYDNANDGIIVRRGRPVIVGIPGTSNKVYGNGRHGISVNDMSSSTVVFSNNVYSNANKGIVSRASLHTTVKNNNVYSNGGEAGIGFAAYGSVSVLNNSIRNNSGVGIGFGNGGSVQTSSTYAYIAGNNIHHNRGIDFLTNPGDTCSNCETTGVGGIGGHDMHGLLDPRIEIINNNIYSHSKYHRASIGFRYPDTGDTSDILIYSNSMPDKENNHSAIMISNGDGSGAIPNTTKVKVEKNKIGQQIRFLRVNNVDIDDNELDLGGIYAKVQYLSGSATQHKVTIRNNLVDMKNEKPTAINISPDNSNYDVYSEIFSNIVRNCTEAGLKMGFADGMSYDTKGFIRNNQIYSTFDGMLVKSGSNLEVRGNTIFNQTRRGIRLSSPKSGVGNKFKVSENLIYSCGNNNSSNPPDSGVVASLDNQTVDLQISSNDIWGIKGKGVGVIDIGSNALLSITNNTIGSKDKHNTREGIGVGLSALGANSGNIYIADNSIRYNNRSGIGLSVVNNISIQNNIIINNGSDYYYDGNGFYDASGIRAHASLLGLVADNVIRSNKFSGIALNDAGGYIGPNNTIRFNGSGTGGGGQPLCDGITAGPAEGDGAVAIRTLDQDDTVIVSDNIIADNILGSVTRKDCGGTVRLNGVDVSCLGGNWYADDAATYINANNTTLDGLTISNGHVWGVAIAPNITGVTIRNCVIEDNMLSTNNYGPGGSSLGGGILVSPGSDAAIYNNVIRRNGAEVAAFGFGTNSGIALRCSNSEIWSNSIYSNASDGIDVKDSDIVIGHLNGKNNIYNNGRAGIGASNNCQLTVENNDISSNMHGIGFNGFSGSVWIKENTVWNNLDVGIGLGDGNPGFSGYVLIDSNTIHNNEGFDEDIQWWAAAGIAGKNLTNSSVTINNNLLYSNLKNKRSNIGFTNDVVGNEIDVTVSNNTFLDYGERFWTVHNRRFSENQLSLLLVNGVIHSIAEEPGMVRFDDSVADGNTDEINNQLTQITGLTGEDRSSITNVWWQSQDSHWAFESQEYAGNIVITENTAYCSFRFQREPTYTVSNKYLTVEVKDNPLLAGLGSDNWRWGAVNATMLTGDRLIVDSNIFEGYSHKYASNAIFGHGTTETDILDTTIINNEIKNYNYHSSRNYGILMGFWTDKISMSLGNSGRPISGSIANNTVRNINNSGIRFDYPDNMSITGNQVFSVNYFGILVKNPKNDVLVDNNLVSHVGSGFVRTSFAADDCGLGINMNSNSGNVTVSNNRLWGINGDGLIIGDADTGDTVLVMNNIIGRQECPNDKQGIGIGFKWGTQNNADISLSNNIISYNDLSGISFSLANNVSLLNNTIVSNGQDYFYKNGLHDASGIRAKESRFVEISGNSIRNNRFSGIASYNTEGTIGPNNVITGNGGEGVGCENASGKGAISVRDLEVTDSLIVSDNAISQNANEIAWKDCIGTIRLDGTSLTNCRGYFTPADAARYVDEVGGYYVNGVFTADISSDPQPTINCLGGEARGGVAWGIIVQKQANGKTITVQNCNVFSNNTQCNSLNNGSNIGGGIFIASEAKALVFNNTIYSNGCETPAEGEGGSVGITLGCAESTVINNLIYDNKGDGVEVRSGTAVLGMPGSGNSIYHNGRHGIGAAGDSQLTIENNQVFSNYNGIGFSSFSGNVRIIDNEIQDNSGEGIGLGYTTAPFTGCALIYSNKIHHNDGHEYLPPNGYGASGIGGRDLNNATISISNNTIYSNTEYGRANVGFRNGVLGNSLSLTVSNNQFLDLYRSEAKPSVALEVQHFDGNVLVTGNTSYGSLWFVRDGSLYTPGENFVVEIKDNPLLAGQGPQVWSFGSVVARLLSEDKVIIDNNVFDGFGNTNASNAIFGRPNTDNDLLDLTITNNMIRNYISTGIRGGSLSNNSSRLLTGSISNNTFENITYSALHINAIQDMTISNNYIFSIGQAGMNFRNPRKQVLIDSNVFSDIGNGLTWDNYDDSGISINCEETTLVNVTICSNRLWDIDGQAIAVSDTDVDNNITIINNIIGNKDHPNTREGIGAGLRWQSANDGDYLIEDNIIEYHDRSGIGFSMANNVSIINNTIASNGFDNDPVDGEYNASGIRGKLSTFSYISGNSIRNNQFSGIASYDTEGTIGPNNVILYNGDGDNIRFDCASLVGVGGGVTARELTDSLIVSDNVIESNYASAVSRADCGGNVYLDGVSVANCEGGGWVKDHTRVFVDSSGIYLDGGTNVYTTNLIIDGDLDPTFSNISGDVWGVAILNGVQGVTIRNCTIENNMTVANQSGATMGGGILVGPGAEAQIYSNIIRNNGGSESYLATNATDKDLNTEWRPLPAYDNPSITLSFYNEGEVCWDNYWWAYTNYLRVRTVKTMTPLVWDVYSRDSKIAEWTIGDEGTVVGEQYWDVSPHLFLYNDTVTLKLKTKGVPVVNHFYEFEFGAFGGSWFPRATDTLCNLPVEADNELVGNGSGIVARCNNENTQVWNNQIYSNGTDGIDINGGIAVIGGAAGANSIYNNHYNGIGLRNISSSFTIENNIISSNLQGGIRSKDNSYESFVVRDNLLRNNAGYDLSMMVLTGNGPIVIGPDNYSDYGIRIRDAVNHSLSVFNNPKVGDVKIDDIADVTISNNSSIRAIMLRNLEDCIIVSNAEITGGLAADTMSFVRISNNSTISNRDDTARNGLAMQNIGVYAVSITNNSIISGGMVFESERFGIDLLPEILVEGGTEGSHKILGKASLLNIRGSQAYYNYATIYLRLEDRSIILRDIDYIGDYGILDWMVGIDIISGRKIIIDNSELYGSGHMEFPIGYNNPKKPDEGWNGSILGFMNSPYGGSVSIEVLNNSVIGSKIFHNYIDNLSIDNSSIEGFYGSLQGPGTISNSSIGGFGVSCEPPKKFIVDNCVFDGSSTIDNHGIQLSGYTYWGSKLTFTNNTVKNYRLSGAQFKGYHLDDHYGYSVLSISNNTFMNNGLDNIVDEVDGRPDAMGIRLKDCSLEQGTFHDNYIYSNLFAGIGMDINVDYFPETMMIGPNNIIRKNGNAEGNSSDCYEIMGAGSGAGGISIRKGNASIFNNVIEDNILKSVSRYTCDGTSVIYNGQEVPCPDSIFISIANRFLTTSNTTIDCEWNETSWNPISGGEVWGIAVKEGVTGLTIQNCSITNNYTTAPAEVRHNGGGILLAPNTDVTLINNTIFNNGYTDTLGDNNGSGVVAGCDATLTMWGNIIYSNARDGVNVNSDCYAEIGGLINGQNSIYNNGSSGVRARNFNELTVENNQISNHPGTGIISSVSNTDLINTRIKISNNTIRNNGVGTTDTHAGGVGLDYVTGTAEIRDNVIVSNTSYGAPGGIALQSEVTVDNEAAANVYLSGNSISNNTDSGIGLRYFSGVVSINNNEIINHPMAGLEVQQVNDIINSVVSSDIYRLHLFDNQIRSNAFTGMNFDEVSGYVGPNNTFSNNGSNAGCALTNAILAKNLETDLIVSGNLFENNQLISPVIQDNCIGTVIVDGQTVSNCGPAWDQCSGFRWPLTISNTSANATTLTDYQVPISLPDEVPVDMASFLDNGEDVRFTESDGLTPLNFWIESWDTGMSAALWVKVPTLPVGETIIYLYGGNPAASAVSDYDNTFTKIPNDVSGLVGLWHMDDGTSAIKDSSGNNNHGTIIGATWQGSDGGQWDSINQTFTNGNHLSFDGINDYVSIPDDDSLDVSSITIVMWIYRSVDISCDGENNWRFLLAKSNGWSSYNLIYEQSNEINFTVNVGGTLYRLRSGIGGGQVPVTTWTHVAFTYDAATGKQIAYINGVETASQDNTPGDISDDTQDLHIGNGISDTSCPVGFGAFPGQIDEVAIYDRALSVEEILAHYYRCKPSDAQLTVTAGAEEVNSLPDTPSNLSPLHPDNINIPVIAELSSSIFSDSDGHSHLNSRWQISTGTGRTFDANIVYDATSESAATSHTLTNADALLNSTQYYWHVQYQDTSGAWSAFSTETSFTTEDNTIPSTPTNISPANGLTEQDRSPILTASNFSDTPDSTHAASQWQISTGTGGTFDANIVYGSGSISEADKTRHTVTASLSAATQYYWHVRYQDNAGAWSDYSAETSFTTVAFPTILDKAVSLWKFDEDSDSTAFDSIGNNDGNLQGSTAWITGKLNSALSFNGTTDYVNCGTVDIGSVNTITYEAWIKPTVITGNDYLITRDSDNNNTGASLRFNSDGSKLEFYIGDGTSFHFFAVPHGMSVGNWYHVVSTYDGAKASIYVNGVLKGSINDVFIPDWEDGAYSLKINNNSNTTMFTGEIDEVVVYNQALTEKEVRERYLINAKVSYWKFDDYSGTHPVDSVGSNNGTFAGDPTWTTGRFGSALSFDGVDDFVSHGTTGFVTNTFSYEAWVKTSETHEIDPEATSGTAGTSGQQYVFGPMLGGVSGDAGTGLSVGTNGISVYEHDGGYMPPLAVYSGDIGTNWNHIVVVYDNKRPTIYLNGVAVRTGLTSPKTEVYLSWAIGGMGYGFFNGQIDEVAVYNVALPPNEIKESYLASTRVGYWKFNEMSGTTAFNEVAGGNNGTYSGSISQTGGKFGQAVQIDAANSYVDGLGRICEGTMEGWMYLNAAPAADASAFWDFGDVETNNSFHLTCKMTRELQVHHDSTATATAYTIPLKEWIHLAVTKKDGNAQLFVNGSLEWSGVYSIAATGCGTGGGTVGGCCGNYLDFKTDELAVYDTVLAADLIKELYDERGFGAIAYWKLDTNNNNTAEDSAGNFDGTIAGATLTSGKYGNALNFDGSGDSVSIPGTSLLASAPEFSVEFWLKVTQDSTGAWRQIIWKGDGSNRTPGIWLFPNDRRIHYRISTTSSWNSGGNSIAEIPLNTWTHVAYVVDDGVLKLYLNGELDSSAALSGTVVNNNKTLYLGSTGTGLGGLLDEVAIYDRALTAEEVQNRYLERVAYWSFDENSGSTAYESIAGNDGAVLGASWAYGRLGSALSFDGIDDLVSWALPVTLNKNAATLAWWMKPSNANSSGLFSKLSMNSYNSHIESRTNQIFAETDINCNNFHFNNISKPTDWTYNTIVFDNAKAYFYVNGEYVKEANDYGQDVCNGNNVDHMVADTTLQYLGGPTAYNPNYSGLIDEVEIYNSPLSANEIRSLSIQADAGNSAPDRPANVSPTGTGIPVVPTLTASSFNDAENNAHQASRWQIRRADGSYGDADSYENTTPGLISHTLDVADALDLNTTYYWRVQYQDHKNAWSAFSAETGFTTDSSSDPFQPVNISPSEGAGDQDRSPVLTASAFLDQDGDSHAASQWQVSTGTGADFSANMVYDSGIVTELSKTQHTITASLDSETTFYWHVRYQDNNGNWSPYSNEFSFTTAASQAVSIWKFGDNTGDHTLDSAGSNHGIIYGASWTTGKVDTALSFDGTDDYVDVGNDSSLSLTGDLTIEAWIYPTGTLNGECIITKHFNGEFDLTFWGQKLYYYNGPDYTNNNHGFNYTFSANKWYHIALVRNGADKTVNLFVNGSNINDPYTYTDTPASIPSTKVYIGGRKFNNSQYYSGKIDEVSLYNWAVGENEIREEFLAGARFAEWKFDENSGTKVYDSADLNNGSQDGTMSTSGVSWTAGKFGSALSFDGLYEHGVEVGGMIMSGFVDFSVSFWVKSTQNSTGSEIRKSPNLLTNQWGEGTFVIANHGGKLGWSDEFVGGVYNQYNTGKTIADGTWHHVTVVRTSSTVTLYVDGGNAGSKAVSATPLSSAAYDELGIAHSHLAGAGNDFNGELDEMIIYDVALPDDVVKKKFGGTSYWKLDESSGSTAYDVNGTSDGTVTGAAWTPGKSGNALYFDGKGDYVQASGSGPLKEVTDSSFTFVAWAKPQNLPPNNDNNDVVYGVLMRTGWHLGLYYHKNSRFYANIWNSTPDPFNLYSEVLDPGTWHHLAMVVDDVNKKLHFYVDGQPVSGSPKTYTGTLRDYGTTPYYIGAHNPLGANNRWVFDGQIDEAAVYNYALSADEILGIFGGRANAAPDRPVNVSPDGATGISLLPTLTANSFSDPDGDAHQASRWQIRRADGSYGGTGSYERTTTGVSSHSLSSPDALDLNTSYYWRVQYQDSTGAWSAFSTETSFTTVEQ